MGPETLADPETDALATYVVDPALARRLTSRVVCAPRRAVRTTHSPLTGGPIAALPLSTSADVAVAVQSARAAQRSWAHTSMEVRPAIMLRLHDLVLERQDEMLDLIQLESGKARGTPSRRSLARRAAARHYARKAPAYLGTRRRGGRRAGADPASRCTSPRASSASSRPWNYPLTVASPTRCPR